MKNGRRRANKWIWVFGLFLLLPRVAGAQTAAGYSSVLIRVLTSAAHPTSTPTRTPTRTPTPTVTQTPTNTPTPIPSATPVPTSTPANQTPPMSDYSASPILVSDAVIPNVMILYSNDHTNWYGGYNNAGNYDNSQDYYGYFDSFKCYSYGSGNFSPTSINGDHKCGGNWSGNFMNWLTMAHGDFARKAITGGRRYIDSSSATVLERGDIDSSHQWKRYYSGTDIGSYTPYGTDYSFCSTGIEMWTRSGNSDCYVSHSVDKFNVRVEVCNAAVGLESNCVTYTESGVNYKPEGLVARYRDRMYFGLMTYSHDTKNDIGGIVRRPIGPIDDEINPNGTINSGVAGIMRYMNEFTQKGWDPIGEMYYEAVRYFKGQTPTAYYYPGNVDDSFPVYGNENSQRMWLDPQKYSCQKNFIIIINDEYPSKDHDDLPGSNYGSTVSDAAINVASLTDTVGAAEGINGNTYQIGRTGSSQDGNCTDKTINSLASSNGICPSEGSTYGSFYIAGLAYYANVNDLRGDFSGTQNIRTYAIAFRASPGAYSVPPDPLNPLKLAAKYGGFEDTNGNNLPDLDSEWDKDGNGEPDTFQHAEQGSQFEEALSIAFSDILQRASSGTAVSVLATSASGEGNVFQAFFLPAFHQTVAGETRKVTWIGHLLKLGVDAFGSLTDSNGDEIHFAFNNDSGQTVVVNNSSGLETPLTDWNDYLWNAGEVLQNTASNSRNVMTFIDTNKNGGVDSGEVIDFTTANAATLRPYLDQATTDGAQNEIEFIRGEAIQGYRFRDINGSPWKLGDIVFSNPVVVTEPAENFGLVYGDTNYTEFFNANKDREQIVVIGANDGGIHAFRVSDGQEVWMFIPQALLPHLQYLTREDYAHIFYVDLKPKVTEIQIGGSYRTVLIGGMRLGGGEYLQTDNFGSGNETRSFKSSYFMIDITDPLNPQYLWEFTHNDLGLTLSAPAVVKVGTSWFVVVGSGPKALYAPSISTVESSQVGRVFVLNAETGSLQAEFSLTTTKAYMADPTAVDVDFLPEQDPDGTFNTEVLYIGETYKDNSGNWKGRMHRLVTNASKSPSSWVMSTFLDMGQPVSASATVASDAESNLWVFFGTGRYHTTADKTNTDQQSFYGVIEPCWDGTTFTSSCSTAVTTASLLDVSNAVVLNGGATVTGISGVSTFEQLLTEKVRDPSFTGWKLNFSTSKERSVTKPSVVGGLVLFTTFVPDPTNICGYGGSSNLYSLFYQTGTAFTASTIGTESTGGGTEVLSKVSLGQGASSSLGIHVGRESGGRAFIQSSTGAINDVDVEFALNIRSGIISWQEI